MGTLAGVGKQAGYHLTVTVACRTFASRCSSTRSPRWRGERHRHRPRRRIESGAGVEVGGRTGWVAVVTGALFFPFLFFAPLIGMVPPQATAPALIIVGYLMITALSEAEERAEPGGDRRTERKFAGIDFHDLAIGLSAALTIMIMPFAFSITDGIGFGFIAYVLIRIAQGECDGSTP